ncbi:MAG: hypothetical protein NZ920_00765 [Aigarchaeota archaeon]|nr:hypothetical protein [Aigarchaeota archaeon]MDW8092974.1 RING finger domain-containing protein [Nitrososphaerota archaeon]
MQLRVELGRSMGYWRWETLECEVCLNEIDDDLYVRRCPNCNASFHDSCFTGLLNTKPTCPKCKRRLDTNE